MAIKFLLKGQRFVNAMWKENVLAWKVCVYLSKAKWHLNVLKPLIMTQALWHEEEKREREKRSRNKTVFLSCCLCLIIVSYLYLLNSRKYETMPMCWLITSGNKMDLDIREESP